MTACQVALWCGLGLSMSHARGTGQQVVMVCEDILSCLVPTGIHRHFYSVQHNLRLCQL